jgi:putative NADPH-quinone reductase
VARRILIVDGHPDADKARFLHALADSYRHGAEIAGHEARTVRLCELAIPFLGNAREFAAQPESRDIREQQEHWRWAQHVVLLYPLWLGSMPALVKAYLEQLMRPGFAFAYRDKGFPRKLLKGKSARIVVTMGMPSMFYRLYYRAHSVRSLARNILGFVGIDPV